MKLVPVILSGGSGTRLWPLSRELLPKQLLALTGERTMLQETAARFAGLGAATGPVVVCNEAHRFLVAEQLREMQLQPTAILLEPVGRNTAPAIALAAHAALSAFGEDVLLLVLPADHTLSDLAAFQSAIRHAVTAGESGKLVAFGIVARSPETGYGYLRTGKPEPEGSPVRPIAQFVEKPDLARAREFVASGQYFWNSGMFLFGAQRFLDELASFAPDIAASCTRASATAVRDADFTRIDAATFAACRSDSVDYAVMEKTRDAVMVPLDAGWNDVGSWSALHEILPADEQGNVARGDVLLEDVRNSYVHADSRLVAALGIDDLVIVETADSVLVAPRSKVQDVKKIVARIKASGRAEHLAPAAPNPAKKGKA
ncbi:MAG TPA: mannose-1-phosphate guanylyltransferase/mannose-6-phosphate isomerase [Gemmatimonadales bacterium]|nr:mannose-1-phosphate guanylyltransferase/mannose-6-phosphate isomerase [Gemmatimonadales bacterium]HET9864771.1 mannose-1-phosphate guanylyltransferase/mannose-6-phosphate isomerase [Steroidobacteraceae bacterium]